MNNFVFISANFPKNYYEFPKAWKQIGGTALVIGEEPYETLSQDLKNVMDEYYQVGSMQNYDEMYRAVAWFAHKHGKIDWLESNNEFWLEQDARLREDFNITTGDRPKDMMRYKLKSNMKAYYQKAGVPTARWHLTTVFEEGKKFVTEVGYPVVVKPNDGVGANSTCRIRNEKELRAFYQQEHHTQYIMEEYVPGTIVSFDGLTDQDGKIIFQTAHTFPEPIMNVVNEKKECTYYSERKIPHDLEEIGTKVISAFGIKARFFHTEYFRLSQDKPGLGKKGDLVGLEVNMRPPGGYTPDMMNYANDINIYSIYTNMCMFNTAWYDTNRPYYCVYTGKRDGNTYKNSDPLIYARFGSNICMHERMPDILSGAMGNNMYIARFRSLDDVRRFTKFVYEKPSTRKRRSAK